MIVTLAGASPLFSQEGAGERGGWGHQSPLSQTVEGVVTKGGRDGVRLR